jgi:hypothetical protein
MVAAALTVTESAIRVTSAAEVTGGAVRAVTIHKGCRAWEPSLLDKTTLGNLRPLLTIEKFNDPDRHGVPCKARWHLALLFSKSKEKAANLSLVGGFLFLGSLLFGTRSPSTVVTAITAGAVVGDVEPRAIEDDGWRRKQAAHLAVTVWTLLQRRIAEMSATLKMQPTGQTFRF